MKFKTNNLLMGNSDAEKDIAIEIDKIIDELISSPISKDVIVYMIGGGFGRGEGNVIRKNGLYTTSNDYDFFAICENSVEIDKMACLERNVEKKWNLNFFGVEVIKLSKWNSIISQKKISQSDFDKIKGCKILWMNDSKTNFRIQDEINAFNKKEHCIIYRSAFDVLHTRMWCAVALEDYNHNDLFDRDYVKSENLYYYQQVKLCTAIIDAVLIAEFKYDTPCFERKIHQFKHSEFSKIYNTNIISDLVYRKIHNLAAYALTKDIRLEIHRLYCLCVEYVIQKQKGEFIYYKISEKLHAIYRIMRKRSCDKWQLDDYRYISGNNVDKLKKIQAKMRRLYP